MTWRQPKHATFWSVGRKQGTLRKNTHTQKDPGPTQVLTFLLWGEFANHLSFFLYSNLTDSTMLSCVWGADHLLQEFIFFLKILPLNPRQFETHFFMLQSDFRAKSLPDAGVERLRVYKHLKSA